LSASLARFVGWVEELVVAQLSVVERLKIASKP
jgi:hypothetical protein